MFTIGGTDLYIHKYLGPSNEGPSNDATQPQYAEVKPTNIQDLLFLENRDRKYDPDIYRLRGHYNVQNLDFDLSQFGLFLNNDIIFITVHYNDMIELVGRKLMVGDVFELPHLTDYHPLNDALPIGLRRYYQVTDANFASEGFSQTWYPHLWRIKCEPLVNSQEYSDILDQPINKDNYLGDWDSTKTYVSGYVVSYGDKNYTPKEPGPVPPGTPCTDTEYWQLDGEDTLSDIVSRYNLNIQVNDAAIEEALRQVPLAGYDRSQLYIVPTFEDNQPAPPIDLIVPDGAPTGTVEVIQPTGFSPSVIIRLVSTAPFSAFTQMSIQLVEFEPEQTDSGSGSVEPDLALAMTSLGDADGPYVEDNGYMSSAALLNSEPAPGFKYIARSTPRSFGYEQGYLVGTSQAPNGEPVGSGIAFPGNPKNGDYFLRVDYLPQQLFRWNNAMWIKISDNVRTGLGFTEDDKSQLSTFVNNSNVTVTTNGTMPEKQALSTILRIKPD
jgi:hypothetical protein